MSEMVELVTYAIKAEMGRQLSAQPLHGHASDWHASGGSLDLELLGRAAVGAMREPSDKMIEAGAKAMVGSDEDAMECWPAMIDEALK